MPLKDQPTSSEHVIEAYERVLPTPGPIATVELLEKVLSYLPRRSLFVYQRVSRKWKHLIGWSPELARHMFPGNNYPVLRNKFELDNLQTLPRRTDTSVALNKYFKRWLGWQDDPLLKLLFPELTVQTLLTQPGRRIQSALDVHRAALSIGIGIYVDTLQSIRSMQSHYSWFALSLTLPRIESVHICIKLHRTHTTIEELCRENGVTLGDLVQHIKSVADNLLSTYATREMTSPNNYTRVPKIYPKWFREDHPAEKPFHIRCHFFNHLLEPCTVPECKTLVPKIDAQTAQQHTALSLDDLKAIHKPFHREPFCMYRPFQREHTFETRSTNRLINRKDYIDIDSEFTHERSAEREVNLDPTESRRWKLSGKIFWPQHLNWHRKYKLSIRWISLFWSSKIFLIRYI